LKKRLKRDKVF